jgi:hypothetical protein
MKIENANYKEQVLIENAEEACMSLPAYVNYSAENDPGFYRWLFGNEASEYDDFVCPDKAEFEAFCSDLFY